MDRLDDNYSSPFRGSPFERRFRGIHTVSQQIRSRDAHYETGDQDILRKPRSFFSRSRPRAFTAAGSADPRRQRQGQGRADRAVYQF
jgi:hypothetical protein